ncbi:RNA polymerase II C-terminal domain phosphatase-like 3 [Rutidosis leptorrhynchoides]|uniref:RNA polymerase II C-terminal domain phosphatase-like 3 n=1 Tax=Rutidosis leptorrhynchoides TaxID=125765 RepID=UPI003A99638F
MGKDIVIVDVEEGEISDSAGVEEISASEFTPKSPAIIPETKSETVDFNKNAIVDQSKQQPQQQQVWTMEDLVKYQKKYQMSRNYAPGLYNFAWAQAVQNKPLDSYLTTMNNNNNNNLNNDSNQLSDVNNVVVDVSGDDSEKEEGEIEEGEIDLDVDMNTDTNTIKQGDDDDNALKLINVIRIGFEGITMNDANKSFSGVCSRLEDLIDSLSKLLSETSVDCKDDLVRLAFSAIQTVYSVFRSMSQDQKEQSRHLMSRMLTNVKNNTPVILSPEQLKEVETMLQSCNSPAVSLRTKDSVENGDVMVTQEETSVSKETVADVMRVEPVDQSTKKSESLSIQTSTFKNRVLLPLLDLHKDHDVDSLPSPTRENTNSLPLGKGLFARDVATRPEWPTPRAVLHRYETDALKAVSSYQQKFGRSSFMTNDLPSPTPSEESGDAGGDVGCDYGGEVSSFSTVQNSNSVTQATLELKDNVISPFVERPTVELFTNSKSSPPVYSISSSVTRVPNKTRDPRLRLANNDNSVVSSQGPLSLPSKQPKIEPLNGLQDSRKQRSLDELVMADGPALKRPKNDVADSAIPRNTMAVSQSSGWLEDRVSTGMRVSHRTGNVVNEARGLVTAATTSAFPNNNSNGSLHVPVTGINPTSSSLQSILKDIAVNPAQWMNLISMEQQKSADPPKSVTQTPSQNPLMGSTPMTTVASQPLVIGQRSTAEMQIPQAVLADDSGIVRMKPRDPRRVLHSKSSQKPELKKPDLITSSSTGDSTKGNSKRDPRLSSKPVSAPDITHQFTKNLKNIADIVSTTATASVQTPSQIGSGPTAEVAPGPDPSQPQNDWGEVEQYFGKFDDKQLAAIQRERSKRMEEQKKMFAERKLCLVLDLDHTLLNSAKFSEIEPLHDEMLKKKEEQDREKPHRHLFKFPHMCMWTKLRPGIWKFLEKASKLYELHLYTMGNKLYATEMAKVLDPKGVLFNGRVISRGDDGDNVDGDPKSKDLEGVLGMESAVVIIDDSIRVWPHNKLNLIVVERYIYFPCSRRQFGLPGPSLLEIDHDERPEDGTLASSLAVIEKIHEKFFMEKSLDDADVRNILASEQRKILGGCRIVFSRVIPVGEASPHLHPLWQTAEQFGAVCTNQIDEQVTHVVANSLGTDKVNWALATGRPVVHPGWVEASALLYRRANEHDFAVKP